MSESTGKHETKRGAKGKPTSPEKQRKRRGEPVSLTAPDFLAEQKEQLRQLMPHVFTEGKIDLGKLRAAVGDAADERPERYSLTWAGKRAAIQELQKPTWGTLVPAKDESINFDTTRNIFIEGENLEVLKLLYKSYFGRVKMIYVDPPYNTGNDFVYPDDFADSKNAYLRITGQKDAAGNLLTSNPESSGRYHSAWLTMLYPRLFLARQLLQEDGVIFVSIDDHEVHNLRILMNEIFGEENFLAQITVLNNPKGRVLGEHFALCHDYILVYSRARLSDELGIEKTQGEVETQYPHREGKRSFRLLELRNSHRQFNRQTRKNLFFPIYVEPKDETVSIEKSKTNIEVLPLWDDGFEGCWTWGQPKVSTSAKQLVGRKVNGRWKIFRKAFADDESGNTVKKKLQTIWQGREFHTEVGQGQLDELIKGRVFDAPKPVGLIKQIAELVTNADSEDLVLDFYSGSGTTAQAVLELNGIKGGNRRFICIQLPQPTAEASQARKEGFATIAEITKERIRRCIKRLEKSSNGELDLIKKNTADDFGCAVFKLVPSNIKPWINERSPSPETLAAAMELFNDPLTDGWKSENVIYEVAVKEGFTLASRIEKNSAIKANKVFAVADPESGQSFRICLDDEVKPATIKELNLKKEDLFICRDVAIDDKTAANLALQCRLKTI